MTAGPLIVQSDKTLLLEVDHPDATACRMAIAPFAELKLDRNLVMNCGEDETNAALCQTGIDLAHRFGTQAVAEGIEKASELECLFKMGFDMGQGYLFAPPMAKDRFSQLLRQRAQRRAG